VGIVNGPANDVVNLSWGGVSATDNGHEYVVFTEQLKEITRFPVVLSEEFETHFHNKFGFSFPNN